MEKPVVYIDGSVLKVGTLYFMGWAVLCNNEVLKSGGMIFNRKDIGIHGAAIAYSELYALKLALELNLDNIVTDNYLVALVRDWSYLGKKKWVLDNKVLMKLIAEIKGKASEGLVLNWLPRCFNEAHTAAHSSMKKMLESHYEFKI